MNYPFGASSFGGFHSRPAKAGKGILAAEINYFQILNVFLR
jgi:hypothetical protein